jgi:cytochrome c553
MKKKSIFSVLVLVLFSISLIGLADDRPIAKDKMPENVKAALDKSCYGCHNSDSKNDDAKEALDLKKMKQLSMIKKISAFKEIGETIEKGEMPPKKFVQRYPDRQLSEDEKELLINWSKKEAEALVKGK